MNGYQYNPLEAKRQMLQNQLSVLDAQMMNQPIGNPMAPQQMMPMMGAMLSGRIVSSVDDVQNLPCPTDGSGAYYPCPSRGEIYVKQIGNDGLVTTTTYVLKKDKPEEDDRLSKLEARVAALEGGKSNG